MDINIHNARFEISAVRPEQYPGKAIPEIAFAGRSNVGKSSLINCLLNRKNLARAGATPGKTRAINFYNIDNRLYFVDLPGYGYAKASRREKEAWAGTINTYLAGRKQLCKIVFLVDIRHDPTEDDRIMNSWLQSSGIPYIIAATKADKIKRSSAKKHIDNISKELKLTGQVKIIPFSSIDRQGREELWEELLE